MADLVRIPRVPILSTGEFTFTAEDLVAAAAAPATDPAVHWPRIKIDGLSDSFDQGAHGGEPAFGRVENLEVDGETLYGDYLIPAELAAVIDWAYPSRSIEGMPGSVMGPTATGRTHELVITAVALLGVDLPGVSTLPDLMDILAQFSGEAEPEQVAVLATADTNPIRGGEQSHRLQRRNEIRAGLDQELVRRRFFDVAEAGGDDFPIPDGERGYDLWIRSLRFDDDGAPFLVVEAWESGRLYRYSFAVSGNDVSFTLQGEVVEQYVAASAAGRRSPVAVWASREDSRAVMATQQEANSGMTEEQRRLLATANGLDPDTATESDIMAAAQSAADARQAEAAGSIPETPVVPDPEPVAASAEARTRTVTATQWDETQSRLAAAEAALATRDQADARAHRDGLIAAALSDGRIAPAERDQWRSDLDDAPEATERILARLTPNRVPVAARGQTRPDGANAGADEEASYQQFMAGFGKRHRGSSEGVREVTV